MTQQTHWWAELNGNLRCVLYHITSFGSKFWKFQDKDSGPKTGWDVFRRKNTELVKEDGFVGKAIASQLGDRWRKLDRKGKRQFGLQAYTLKKLNPSPEKLDKTQSVKLNVVESADCEILIPQVCVKRRNSI